MKPFRPIIKDGKKYDEYAVNLTSAPLISGGDYTTAVNLVLTPMRYDEESQKYELLQDPAYVKVVAFSDIKNQADPATLQAFGAINTTIQQFINSKEF